MQATKLCLLVLFISQAFAFEQYLAQVANAAAGNQAVPEAQWFTQRLDHFNHQDTRTWQQRFFINDSFWDPTNEFNGPIFVQIGGEGPISGAYVTVLQMVDYAQRYGALVLALEHRFYGESYPLPDLSTDNLQYLSSQQALADVAEFITYMKNYLGALNSPVVTFGCSYPGNLAAWFRMNYPTVTIASVASSSPVQATFDFYQYLDVVNTSLADVTGEECDRRIQEASDTIQNMLQSQEGVEQLQTMFNTCENITSKLDIATMIASLMGNFQGVVQYNDENGNPIDIKYLCKIMTNESQDALSAYIQVNNLFVKQQNAPCFDISYENQVNELANTSTTAGIASGRSWVYQTCTQFGYFQTTDSENQPFGDLVPAAYYARLCEDAFGIDPNTIQPNIDETNVLYGGKNIPATGPTNILFVNGNIDPWHSLGVTEDISDSLRAILIDGTAHCANVLPASPNDLPSLVAAREQTAIQIGAWLLEAIHKN